MRRFILSSIALALAIASCTPNRAPSEAPSPAVSASSAKKPKTLTIVGTNDFHGHLDHLPALSSYVARLRELRSEAGGAVLLVDAGDMFQGTLEANLNEGESVIAGYNALGYNAAALGNHDFDYGPIGDMAASAAGSADPQGALKARLVQAKFPVLSANLRDQASGSIPAWKNLSPSVLIELAGVHIGIIGALTADTPKIVMPAYFKGLAVAPLAPAVVEEAKKLRSQGAEIVVVAAHAGGEATRVDNPQDQGAYSKQTEVVELAKALPPGSVDVIVAGHTHKSMAHWVSGIAVVESYSYGRAFSRVDVSLPAEKGARPEFRILPPQEVCTLTDERAPCTPHAYEGADLVRDAKMDALLQPYLAAAEKRRAEKLGVQIDHPVREGVKQESSLGNLFTDLLLESQKNADVAILNGGGFRAPLPSGTLTYGELYEAMPFDNRVSLIHMTGADLERIVSAHLAHAGHGLISIAGARVEARCAAGRLNVKIVKKNGAAIAPNARITVATSDYLATGGDELFSVAGLPPEATQTQTELIVREALAERLRARGGRIDGEDPKLFDPKHPRLTIPSGRPVQCATQ